MNENHSRKFSEEQLDRLVQTVLRSTILTDEKVAGIADAARLQRQLQSRIADEKERRKQRGFFGWYWQATAAGALAVLIAAAAFVWIFNLPKADIAAVKDEKITAPAKESKLTEGEPAAKRLTVSPTVQPANSPVKIEKSLSPASPKIKSTRVQSASRKIAGTKNSPARKFAAATEFIALSYLPPTESGQIVRVKVPRSMMISLGVTTNAENAAELINAEVVVGDDGAARAIRFLGQ